MLALTGAPTPSLVLLRSADRLSPEEQGALLLANFETFEAELAAGAIVSLSRDHLRVRPLPIVKRPHP
jgi:predicted nuclease of predicted toxin-antitoxin system